MRFSDLVPQTQRELPAHGLQEGERLLVQAGFLRVLDSGIFAYLHLGWRCLDKIEGLARKEMNAIGGQEIHLPSVDPQAIGDEPRTFREKEREGSPLRDSGGHDLVGAAGHEKLVTDLVRREIRSYRQLPRLLYHIQTTWREDPRPRSGLMHSRESRLLHSYSLDADEEGRDRQSRAHREAYARLFRDCGLPPVAVEGESRGEERGPALEFVYLTSSGEEIFLRCPSCGYSASQNVARFRPPAPPDELPQPMARVPTPQARTIDELAAQLEIPTSRTAKAVFFIAPGEPGESGKEKLVFAIVRGDMNLSEAKLARVLGSEELRPATAEEIRGAGAVPGYASPVGISRALVVVDGVAANSPNLVAGANEEGFHFLNVNLGRDYQADIVAEIAAAEAGSACPQCGAVLAAQRGSSLGRFLSLGADPHTRPACNFLDSRGTLRPVVMGSYDLALEGLLACIAEEHHDALGLCWPIHVAPFAVHLVLLADASGIPKGLAERVYADLQANSVEVLYDDREERAGVKFADADLLGVPIRLTVAQRALSQGGVELRLRSRGETERIPPERVVPRVLELRAWLGSAQVPETEGRLRQPAGSGSEGSLGGPEDRERTREEE